MISISTGASLVLAALGQFGIPLADQLAAKVPALLAAADGTPVAGTVPNTIH